MKTNFVKQILANIVSDGRGNEELMGDVQKDDPLAFDVLYQRFRKPIYSYLCSMVFDRESAMELTQDVFIKVFNKRSTYDPRFSVKAWIYKIARNTAIDSFKKADALNYCVDLGDDFDVNESLIDSADPERRVLSKATVGEVENCMQKMPLNQRDTLALKVFSEMSYDEIAVELGTKASVVKMILYRAKKALQLCLEKCFSDK